MTNPNPVLNQTVPEALYSLSKLENACRKDPVFIRKMTDLFIQQLPTAVKDIRGSFEKKDYNTMKAVAHRIKPTLDNMCITSLFQVIRDIETFPDESYLLKLENNIMLLEEIMNKIITDLKKKIQGTI
jgi:HPt (histidine-containing phosphotransfer) domain-containing protein